jgi:hypothetical protein
LDVNSYSCLSFMVSIIHKIPIPGSLSISIFR